MTPPSPRRGEVLKEPSMANLAQILTVDKARLQRRLGTLSRERMNAVDAAITVSLDVG